MFRTISCALYGAALLGAAIAKGVYEPANPHLETRQLEASQLNPTSTSSTNCPDSDGLFYATSHNYTYQLQCSTTYTGEQIITQTVIGFTACILQCASYNHNNSSSTSFCVGVNFNAQNDVSSGDCTLFDEVSPVPNQASEEGSVEDAALLIYGPTGQVFATPEMQPSNVVAGLLSNSAIFTSQPPVPTSSAPALVSTALVTSIATVISCAPGVSDCPVNGIQPSTSPFTTLTSLSPVTSSISISLGGMRPISSARPSTLSPTVLFVTVQATQTLLVPFREYHVTTVVSCTQQPSTTSCTTTATTQTITGLRTELSCSPGACSGVVLATGTLAGMPGIFTGGCIVGS